MNKQDQKLTYVLIGVPALILVFFVGLHLGERRSGSDISSVSGATGSDQVTADQFAPFWKVWKILDQKYVAATSTGSQTKVWGAIEGLTASYGDPYTVFFPPVESKMFHDDIAGNFEGVGMEIGIKDKQLQVVSPLKGSPAEKAGVHAGDLILNINGTSTAGMSTDQAVKLIRGPKGTEIKITFAVPGNPKPVVKTIIRDTINVPTLETSTQEGGIFVIKLFSFTANSADLFRNALREFVLSGDKKLILDLRGNPGGYLDAAWDMASWFLPVGKTVVTEDFGSNQSPKVYSSKGYNVFNTNLQMMILVDNGSASASEILAGALQEQGIAKLVGVKTYGKGSVQELVPITDDTSLKVTIARWLTPKGHNLSHDGLDPDYVVTVSDKDSAAKNDVQMKKAVELLNMNK
jgi:carboxyl-terminal processing protease